MSTSTAPTWPSNHIEHLFESAVKDPAARPVLEREILRADLYIIVDGDNLPEGRVTLQPGSNVGIRMTQDADGTTALPAFTSLALLQRAAQGEPKGEAVSHAVMPGADLFTMTRGTRILVNPFGPYGKQFFPEEIEVLLGRASVDGNQVVIREETQVLLGQLAQQPTDLMKAISDALTREPTVSAAYIAAMATPGPSPAPHPIIGIECSGGGGGYDAVRDRLAPILTRWAQSNNKLVDLFNMNDDSEITRHLKEAHKFYPASWLRRVMRR